MLVLFIHKHNCHYRVSTVLKKSRITEFPIGRIWRVEKMLYGAPLVSNMNVTLKNSDVTFSYVNLQLVCDKTTERSRENLVS